VRDAAAAEAEGVHAVHANARHLPFEPGQCDAIVSIDSFAYYGTDDLCLEYIARWWEPSAWCLHSADWWRRHWARTGLVKVEHADAMGDGWQFWLDWQRAVCPTNAVEIEALEADRGQALTYAGAVARRTAPMLAEQIVSVPDDYRRYPLLRGG
jgi:hypothetical protein